MLIPVRHRLGLGQFTSNVLVESQKETVLIQVLNHDLCYLFIVSGISFTEGLHKSQAKIISEQHQEPLLCIQGLVATSMSCLQQGV